MDVCQDVFWKVKEIMSTCLVTSSEDSGWFGDCLPLKATGSLCWGTQDRPVVFKHEFIWVLICSYFCAQDLGEHIKEGEDSVFGIKQL